jgi:hypothetical protein
MRALSSKAKVSTNPHQATVESCQRLSANSGSAERKEAEYGDDFISARKTGFHS